MTSADIASAPWRTSSYSGGQGQCVEVAPLWRRSSHSGAQGGQCVEVAPLPRTVGVRDSKDRARGHLTVPRAAWDAFVRSVTR